MGRNQADVRIEALRSQLGEARFFRFIASLPGLRSGSLLFWQSRELDLLEQREGLVFPREPSALAALLLPFLPAHPTLAADHIPAWLALDEIGGSAPVQALGHVADPEGRFYFRARHDSWSISISADSAIDPVDVERSAPRCFYHEERFGYLPEEASFMPLDVARFFIVRELTRWRDSLHRLSDPGHG